MFDDFQVRSLSCDSFARELADDELSQWAGKYLMEKGYAAEGKVAISGGSNGGLLVAACVNQAPELWGAAIAE